MLNSLHRIVALRTASIKALLLPRKEYEKMSKVLSDAGVYEDGYDTDLDAVPGKVLITDHMTTWRARGAKVVPIQGWLTQKQIDWGEDMVGSKWSPLDRVSGGRSEEVSHDPLKVSFWLGRKPVLGAYDEA